MANDVPIWLPPLLKTTGALAPALAARIMGELISRPRGRNPTQPWELVKPAAEREVELRHGLFALVTGDGGPAVLALHGWRGRPTQFRPLAAKLLERGFRTISIDGPGHGRSKGEHATPKLYGELLIEIAKIAGGAHAVIGHSFGGAALGAALAFGLRPKRLVIASAPTRVSRMPFAFAKAAGLPARAMPHYWRLLEANAGRPLAELDLVATGPGCDIPALLVHDRQDAVIPYADAEALAALWPELEIMTTEGLGHRDILGNEAVLGRVAAFIAPAMEH
ncbi:MAG TPA: alpha/beta hydrolase [Steroidobacteraceae bacterium]|nr:alpha/beta hydrolase [Steroidobacteraceae bacterium]